MSKKKVEGTDIVNSDPTIKAMRKLLSTLVDTQERAELQADIDLRIKELQTGKINLPASLTAKFK